MQTRRDFLRTAALTAAASAVGTVGAPKFAFAQEAGTKTLVKVFMRGGADGLHLFPRFGDMTYFNVRPNIAIEAPSNDPNSALDLGHPIRGMNPNMAAMMEIWESGRMMVAPSAALEEGNRSHFDCQRWIGTGMRNNLVDGYLNRYLQAVNATDHPLRGASLGKSSIATEMRGEIAVPAVSSAGGFDVRSGDFCSGSGCAENRLTEMMREVSSHEVDLPEAEARVREQQIVLVDTIAEIQAAGADYTPSAGGLDYSGSPLGRGLRLTAQLLKAGVPLSVASLDWNIGWDTHSNQIADGADRFVDQNKGYHRNMTAGATDFLTFWRDISELRDDVVVLVGSEFGRTVYENGNEGTDHGHGGAWFAFGGPTVGGMAAEDVASLDDSNLERGRYMPNLIDYRDIVSEIMIRHMGLPEAMIGTVLPGINVTNRNLFTRVA
ncbi:DUF1501 domain-containing protein [Aestuariibius sp. 2305UL40-4]|uniref:DUF1501 domain-containing protein n=1 Tax=Aestuariibius violaceus TaxID=3234132 RepID=UPI00345F0A88